MPMAVMTWLIAVQRSAPSASPAKPHSMLPFDHATMDMATRMMSVIGTVHFSKVRMA
jgi:hypothetical protein